MTAGPGDRWPCHRATALILVAGVAGWGIATLLVHWVLG
jgi:hypothetical protein